jgi:hypothetical protein
MSQAAHINPTTAQTRERAIPFVSRISADTILGVFWGGLFGVGRKGADDNDFVPGGNAVLSGISTMVRSRAKNRRIMEAIKIRGVEGYRDTLTGG